MPQPWEQFQSTQIARQPWEQFGGATADQPGFIDNVKSDINNRMQQGNAAADQYVAGKITLPEMMLASTGKVVAGSVNDIAGEVINAITPNFIKNGFASGAQTTADALDNTKTGQAVGNNLMSAKNAYQGFMQSNPRTALALESAGNIANTIGLAKGVGSAAQTAGDLVSSGAKGAQGLADMYAAKYPEGTAPLDPLEMKVNVPISADMVRNAGSNAYKAVADSGTTFSPVVTDKALDVIENAKQKPLFGGKVLTQEQAEINSALSDYAGAKGQPMTMEDLQGLDSTLGDKAAQAYVSGKSNKGRIISGVQDKIRQIVQPGNISSSDVIAGSPEGANILTGHAIPLWSTQAKMQDIEKIIDRANAMDNPSTAMKTGFRNLMLNKGKMAQFSPEIQNLVTKAATTGKVDDLLGIVGSRLNAIAGMAGGPESAIVSNVTSAAGRGLRTALKNKQANAVLNSMVENVRPSIEKFSNYQTPAPISQGPMLALPSPNTTVSVDSIGRATPPLSPAGRQILGQAAAAPIEPTLKEIMQMKPQDAQVALDNYLRRSKARR